MFVFRKIWCSLFPCNTSFEIHTFALLPTMYQFHAESILQCQTIILNPLSANFIKWSNTVKQFVGNLPTNCLTVFDHFMGLVLKRLKCSGYYFTWYNHKMLISSRMFSILISTFLHSSKHLTVQSYHRNTKTRYEITHQGDVIVVVLLSLLVFEHIGHLFLEFLA